MIKKINSSDKVFFYSSLLLVIFFLISRLPYYFYYPVINLTTDSASYIAVAVEIMKGNVPLFDLRTPGYPMLLFCIFFFSKNLLAVIFIQSIFTLGSSLFFLRTLSRSFKSLTLIFAIVIAAYISSPLYLLMEATVLTEITFVSFLMISCSFLILSLLNNKAVYWIAYSLSVGFLVMIRPDSLFLIATVFFIVIYFLSNKFEFKYYICLIAPMLLLICLLCSYNYLTLNKFTIAPVAELNLAAVTLLFMDESPDYPEKVNIAIRRTLDSISAKDRAYFRSSNGFTKFYKIFDDNAFRGWEFTGNLLSEDSGLTYVDIQPVLRQVSVDAIRNHPELYLKVALGNFHKFIMNITGKWVFYDELINIYNKIVLNQKYIKGLDDKKWFPFYSDINVKNDVKELYAAQMETQLNISSIKSSSDGNVEFSDTFLKQVYDLFEKVFNVLFRNILWLLIYVSVFVLSIYKVIKTKFKDVNCLIPFLFCAMYLTKGILMSMTGQTVPRYAYTLEFLIYLSLPFLFVLIQRPIKKIIN